MPNESPLSSSSVLVLFHVSSPILCCYFSTALRIYAKLFRANTCSQHPLTTLPTRTLPRPPELYLHPSPTPPLNHPDTLPSAPTVITPSSTVLSNEASEPTVSEPLLARSWAASSLPRVYHSTFPNSLLDSDEHQSSWPRLRLWRAVVPLLLLELPTQHHLDEPRLRRLEQLPVSRT